MCSKTRVVVEINAGRYCSFFGNCCVRFVDLWVVYPVFEGINRWSTGNHVMAVMAAAAVIPVSRKLHVIFEFLNVFFLISKC